jgi:hypothetical protein
MSIDANHTHIDDRRHTADANAKRGMRDHRMALMTMSSRSGLCE